MINTSTITRLANWSASAGNSIIFTYYAAVETGNPSGNTDNLKSLKYYDTANVLVMTVFFEYDLLDRVIKEYSI